MKSLNTFINEKLIVTKNIDPDIGINFFPKTSFELYEIVKKRIIDNSEDSNYVTLDLNDIDVSKIDSFIRMFSNVSYWLEGSHIVNIDISDWKPDKITSCIEMFNSCKNIKKITFGSWDMSNVVNVSKMFSDCSKLQKIENISDWDMSNVVNVSNMFNNCKRLKDIGDISNWNFKNVKFFNEMFNNCSSLQPFDLNKWTVDINSLTKHSVKMMIANTKFKRPEWLLNVIKK